MELLKDKVLNGLTFEIVREEYHEGYSAPFNLFLRVKNLTNQKKDIKVRLDYISLKYGLKKVWAPQELIPDNTFFDFHYSYEDITQAHDGDRIELEVNDGKLATFRLLREKGLWMIVDSIERSTINRDLTNKIEHFESIEEQCGIMLQNFSIRVRDHNSINLFFEVMSLSGKALKNNVKIEVAIYDLENNIVFHSGLFSSDFKGFEVYNFSPINLDILVDEIGKIRIYPI